MDSEKTLFWCSCGKSQKIPYCDGSHKGTDKRPIPFKQGDEQKRLCSCQKTKTPPYCDGSHAE